MIFAFLMFPAFLNLVVGGVILERRLLDRPASFAAMVAVLGSRSAAVRWRTMARAKSGGVGGAV